MDINLLAQNLQGYFKPETPLGAINDLITELSKGLETNTNFYTNFINSYLNITSGFPDGEDSPVIYGGGEINLSRLPDGRLIRRFDITMVGDGEDEIADGLARAIMASRKEMNKNNPTIGRRSNTTRSPIALIIMLRDALYELLATQIIRSTPETANMVPQIVEVWFKPKTPINMANPNNPRGLSQLIFIYEQTPQLLIPSFTKPVTAEQIFPAVMQMAENLQTLQGVHGFIHRNLNAAYVFENLAFVNLRDSVIHANDMTFYGFGRFNRLPDDAYPFEDLYLFLATLYSHLFHVVNVGIGRVQNIKLADSGYELLNRFFGGDGDIQSNIYTRIQAPQALPRFDAAHILKNVRTANNSRFFEAQLEYFGRFIPGEFLDEFNEIDLESESEPEPAPVPEPVPVPMPVVEERGRRPRNAPASLPLYNSYNMRGLNRRSRSRSRERRENRTRRENRNGNRNRRRTKRGNNRR